MKKKLKAIKAVKAQAKVKTAKQPKQKLLPSKMTGETMVAHMCRLMTNSDFKILQSRWLDMRIKIRDHGKAKPSEAAWNILKGFDLAIMEPEIYADIGHKQKTRTAADDLQADLENTTEDGR